VSRDDLAAWQARSLLPFTPGFVANEPQNEVLL